MGSREDRAARKHAYRETFALRNEIIDGTKPGRTFEQMCDFTINSYLAALSDAGITADQETGWIHGAHPAPSGPDPGVVDERTPRPTRRRIWGFR